jgi:hypothetical protein
MVLGLLASLLSGEVAWASQGPALTEPRGALSAAIRCFPGDSSSAHEPVLLVHGTTLTAEENWWWNYVPQMTAADFEVCTVDLPNRAMDDIQASTEYVVHAVRAMAVRTGRKVDAVGFSQGGLELRWAVRHWPDVRNMIDDLVLLATPNHGLQVSDAACTTGCSAAWWQMKIGSAFLTALNHGDETPGRADVTSIYSVTDPVVNPQLPVSTSELHGAENIAVQSACPGRFVDHIQATFDWVTHDLVLDALVHRGPGSLARFDRSNCKEQVMPGVDPVDALKRTMRIYKRGIPMLFGVTYPPAAGEPPLRCYSAPDRCGE